MGWASSTQREFERITTPYLRCSRLSRSDPVPPEGTWQDLRIGEVVSLDVKFPSEHAENFDVTSEALPAVFRILCRGLQHAAGLLTDIDTRWWQTTTFHQQQKPGEHYLDDSDRYILRVVGLLDRLATEHPDITRAEGAQWPKDDPFFFDKLRIYALMKGDVFPGRECAEGILSLSNDGFWNSHHRRELLHTLRARWHDFSATDRRRIEARIFAGPRQWEREEATEYARRKAISAATTFGWLAQQSCKLSAAVERQLPKLRKADERWRPEWDASADESHESRGGGVTVNTDAAKVIDLPLADIVPAAEAHTRHPFFEFTEYRPFEGLVEHRPWRALSALSLEARNGRYPTALWRSALSAWPVETRDRLGCLFAARLVRLPTEVIAELKYDIPRWFRTTFPKLASKSLDRSWVLWDALIDRFFELGAEGNDSGIVSESIGGRPPNRSRRTYNHSINSAIGKLAETLFEILNDLKLSARHGLPPDIRSRLERLWEAPGEGADYAVCETTRRLRWLFYVDPVWVTGKVIPFFDLGHIRAEPAWNAYLHDNELPVPELFALLKPHLLRVFPHSSTWAWDDSPIRRLNEFLVIACYWNLKGHRYISYDEARLALQQAAEEGREHAIWFLTNIVRDLGEWHKFGKPFVERAWPRERKYQTSTSSRNFAHLAEEAGDNFADVVKTVLPLLGPVDHADMLIYAGTRDGGADPLASRFPEAMLSLLDRVIGDQSTPPHDLRQILALIVAAEPTLRQDPRWRRLEAIAG